MSCFELPIPGHYQRSFQSLLHPSDLPAPRSGHSSCPTPPSGSVLTIPDSNSVSGDEKKTSAESSKLRRSLRRRCQESVLDVPPKSHGHRTSPKARNCEHGMNTSDATSGLTPVLGGFSIQTRKNPRLAEGCAPRLTLHPPPCTQRPAPHHNLVLRTSAGRRGNGMLR